MQISEADPAYPLVGERPHVVDDAAASLKRLASKVCENDRAKVPDPTFLAVITGMGEAAYRRPDGVYVIPIRALGA